RPGRDRPERDVCSYGAGAVRGRRGRAGRAGYRETGDRPAARNRPGPRGTEPEGDEPRRPRPGRHRGLLISRVHHKDAKTAQRATKKTGIKGAMQMRSRLNLGTLLCASFVGTLCLCGETQAQTIAVYPPDINLETSRDRQSFVVQLTQP